MLNLVRTTLLRPVPDVPHHARLATEVADALDLATGGEDTGALEQRQAVALGERDLVDLLLLLHQVTSIESRLRLERQLVGLRVGELVVVTGVSGLEQLRD